MKISVTVGKLPFYNMSLECKTPEGWVFSLLIDSAKLDGTPLITPCIIVGDLCFRYGKLDTTFGNYGYL